VQITEKAAAMEEVQEGVGSSEEDELTKSSNVAAGMALCIGAAFLLALSMNIQQFALSCDDDSRIIKRVPRNVLWLFGMFVYLLAQLSFVVAVGMGPFAVMSALFTSVLAFDTIIAFVCLGKRPTTREKAGLIIIMLAVASASQFSPTEGGEVSPANLVDWTKAWSGVTSLGMLGGILFSCMWCVRHFEKEYPDFRQMNKENNTGRLSEQPSPKKLELMRLVYPTALATFETLGAASLKAMSGLLRLIAEGDSSVVSHPALYLVLCIWLACIANTVIWLRKVYAKFRTTECLPTEIGLTTFLSIVFALLFYEERKYINSTNIILLVCSAFVILVGIKVMISGSKVNTTDESLPKHHARRYTLARTFPARQVWHRSISAVMDQNRLKLVSQRSANRIAPAGITNDHQPHSPTGRSSSNQLLAAGAAAQALISQNALDSAVRKLSQEMVERKA
jgi:hypothetical protein